MKKLLLIIALGFLWSGTAYSELKCVEGDCNNGQGTQISDVAKYVGKFKDGKFDGQGTFMFKGMKYIGQWKNGRQNGQGTMNFPDGAKYTGEWKDGFKHGQGIFIWDKKNMKADGKKTGFMVKELSHMLTVENL